MKFLNYTESIWFDHHLLITCTNWYIFKATSTYIILPVTKFLKFSWNNLVECEQQGFEVVTSEYSCHVINTYCYLLLLNILFALVMHLETFKIFRNNTI